MALRHAPTTRRVRRRLGPEKELRQDVGLVARGDEHGSRSSRRKVFEQSPARAPRWPPCEPPPPSASGERVRPRPRARVAERDDDPADVGEALLPGRVLDDDRDDVPAVLEGGQPQLPWRRRGGSPRGRRRRCPAVTARGCAAEVLERALEPVRRARRTPTTRAARSRSSISFRSPFGWRQCGSPSA